MIRKSIKYFLIVFANLAILILLLVIWTDKLEMLYNSSVVFIELLKILGVTTLSLISMRILVSFLRNKNIYEIRKKIKYAVIVTCIVSSFLYINYSKKIIQNRLLNANIRERVWDKSKDKMEGGLLGNYLDDLSFEEYNEISKINWYPQIPQSAEKISFHCSRRDFHGDYSFTLNFEVPVSEKISEMKYNKGQFSKSTNVEIIGNRKKVTYKESEW